MVVSDQYMDNSGQSNSAQSQHEHGDARYPSMPYGSAFQERYVVASSKTVEGPAPHAGTDPQAARIQGGSSMGIPTMGSYNSSRTPVYGTTHQVASVNIDNQWQSGLFDCFQDFTSCCITPFLPCITFGQIAEVVDTGHTSCILAGLIYCLLASCTGCACLYSCMYRQRLRKRFAIQGSDVGDFCVHCWCEPCSLCQEYRELKRRGFDPNLGWATNADLYPASPPVQTMRRW